MLIFMEPMRESIFENLVYTIGYKNHTQSISENNLMLLVEIEYDIGKLALIN